MKNGIFSDFLLNIVLWGFDDDKWYVILDDGVKQQMWQAIIDELVNIYTSLCWNDSVKLSAILAHVP